MYCRVYKCEKCENIFALAVDIRSNFIDLTHLVCPVCGGSVDFATEAETDATIKRFKDYV